MDPLEALKPDAPSVGNPNGNVLSRQTLSRGDVDKAIAEAAFCSNKSPFHTLKQTLRSWSLNVLYIVKAM